jgi:hypothetical protein
VKRHGILFWATTVIAGLTLVSGIVQMLFPGVILSFLAAGTTAEATHFFGIVGMFMSLFGGMPLNAMLRPDPQPVVVLWSGLQKFGAVAAVSLGVYRELFSSLALLVAGFDFVSGILILLYWWSHRGTRPLIA